MPHISEAAPLQISRFYTGLFTFRNPLIVPIRQMGRRIIELYDAISDGLNMETTNRLTLARRPGYTLISPIAIDARVLNFFSFKPSTFPGQIYPLVDTTTVIAWFQANLATEPDAYWLLIPKQTPALTTFATVGAYNYIAQELIASKWDSPGGVQGITNWGIDMYDSAHTKGPASPTAIEDMATNQPNPVPWILSGGTYTTTLTATSTGTLTSAWLEMFGFNIAGETVVQDFEVSGFVVTLHGVSAQGGNGIGLHVRMVRNNQLYGVIRTVTLPAGVANITIGSPSDTWDGAWKLGDITSTSFGVAIQAVNSSGAPATYSLSSATITVFYNHLTIVELSTSTNVPGPTAEIGYRYKYCYGNSHSGHISSPTLPSYYVPPVGQPGGTADGLIVPTNRPVLVYLQPSLDPQVTDIHVFRSTDGGGEPFFELPASPVGNHAPTDPSGRIVYVDGALDNQLEIANICPDPHFNDPPPGGSIDPVWYSGRLWMHRGNQLMFASGPDVSMGNGEEAWYPVYRFALPSGQIVRKFATPNGLLLVTNDDIAIVRGISTASFTITDFVKNIGLRTWTAADTDGTNVYMYSSDRQFLLVNPNGFTSISKNVADTISGVDPALAYVSMFRYTATQNWIFLADGSTTIYGYNQDLDAWATKQVPVNGVGAIGTVETSPGVFQFWRARTYFATTLRSVISFRDPTMFADEGLTYPCSVTFGPIPVADFLTLSQLRDIALINAATTSTITLSVLANEIFPVAGSQYQILQISSSEPPELSATPSLSYSANRYTWKSAPLPELVNLCFLRLDFSADANPDELFSWTLGGSQTTGGSSLGQPGQLPQLQGR